MNNMNYPPYQQYQAPPVTVKSNARCARHTVSIVLTMLGVALTFISSFLPFIKVRGVRGTFTHEYTFSIFSLTDFEKALMNYYNDLRWKAGLAFSSKVPEYSDFPSDAREGFTIASYMLTAIFIIICVFSLVIVIMKIADKFIGCRITALVIGALLFLFILMLVLMAVALTKEASAGLNSSKAKFKVYFDVGFGVWIMLLSGLMTVIAAAVGIPRAVAYAPVQAGAAPYPGQPVYQPQYPQNVPPAAAFPARSSANAGKITGISGMCQGMVFQLEPGAPVYIGTDPAFCQIVIQDQSGDVNARHCMISFDPQTDNYKVKDLSVSGTKADGQVLQKDQEYTLPHSTQISLGSGIQQFRLI